MDVYGSVWVRECILVYVSVCICGGNGGQQEASLEAFQEKETSFDIRVSGNCILRPLLNSRILDR